MTQKSLPSFSATPSPSPHPHLPLTPSGRAMLKSKRMTLSGWAEMLHRASPCLPPQHLILLDHSRGWGGGDSPLLFRTLAEILPAES